MKVVKASLLAALFATSIIGTTYVSAEAQGFYANPGLHKGWYKNKHKKDWRWRNQRDFRRLFDDNWGWNDWRANRHHWRRWY